jgi:hypothetical protein
MILHMRLGMFGLLMVVVLSGCGHDGGQAEVEVTRPPVVWSTPPPLPAAPAESGVGRDSCTFEGVRLYGSVYISAIPPGAVAGADFSIYVSEIRPGGIGFADLSVFVTESPWKATSCGIWYFTDFPPGSVAGADFSVYISDIPPGAVAGADFSIYFTDSSLYAGF